MDSPLNLPRLDVVALLKRYGLRPNKRLGQNFLLDPHWLQRVAEAGEVGRQDTVLEVGPGLGSLTRYLGALARQVVAVELDEKFFPPLQRVLASYPNIRLIQGDILKLDPAELALPPGYLVVANIPYYITSALIRHLLESGSFPSRLVLTIQWEVARRICSAPGSMSLLALSVQVYGKPQIIARIPAGAFYPVPAVDSAIVRVDRYSRPKISPDLLDCFFRLAKAGFGQKRKTLHNALAGGMGWSKPDTLTRLKKAGIDPARRAETLSIDEWEQLAHAAGSLD